MRRALIVLAAGRLLMPRAGKQGKGHGKDHGNGNGHEKETVVVFAPGHRTVVTN